MKMLQRSFAALAVVLAILASTSRAPAAVDMSIGLRYVIPQGTMQECNTKAKTALDAFLKETNETAEGDWHAVGPAGGNGPSSSSAVVRCSAVGKGYVVTFTCVVETPASAYAANDLCLNVAHKFSGKATTALATPKPPPSGCSTESLVGTWTASDKGLTFKMTLDGDVTDNDGISGNWVLYGNQATLTYYGNHTLTLSGDGKHLSGRDYNLTRKC